MQSKHKIIDTCAHKNSAHNDGYSSSNVSLCRFNTLVETVSAYRSSVRTPHLTSNKVRCDLITRYYNLAHIAGEVLCEL